MGEVYRARDTRLERAVAIKILPEQLSSDPVRRQRFEREAKTISGLNHPHICILHDVGSQDGISYLVMECVEGETLAKRLEKGPLPLEQVLKYGAQTLTVTAPSSPVTEQGTIVGAFQYMPVAHPQLAAIAWNLEFPRADLRRDFNLMSGYGVQL